MHEDYEVESSYITVDTGISPTVDNGALFSQNASAFYLNKGIGGGTLSLRMLIKVGWYCEVLHVG